jgi:hypothetical protein
MAGACRVLGVLFLLGLPLHAGAAPVTLSFKTLRGDYKVTFDTAAIAEDDMRRLVLLSPHLHGWQSYAVAPRLELCRAGDPAYRDCDWASVAAADFTWNARANLEKGARLLETLDGLRYPRELEPVVQYSKRSLAFSLWLEQTRFDFYRTGDLDVLRRTYEGVSPAAGCGPVLEALGEARAPDDKHHLTAHAWHNCVNDLYRRRLGEYPLHAWEAFVRAHGILEAVLEALFE